MLAGCARFTRVARFPARLLKKIAYLKPLPDWPFTAVSPVRQLACEAADTARAIVPMPDDMVNVYGA